MSDSTRDLLIRGLAAVRSGDVGEARRYLEWMLRLDPDQDQRIEACLALAEISGDPQEKRDYLESVLARDPEEARARRALAVLEGRLKPEDVINPDLPLRAVVEVEQVTGAKRFICPQCGGRMTFRPDGKTLVCEYCESRRVVPAAPALTSQPAGGLDFITEMATARGHSSPTRRRVFTCQGCGASYLFPPNQLSFTCPHCASPYVAASGDQDIIQPNGVIPFGLEETQAKRALRAWLERNLARKAVRVTSGTAIYIPVWAFDLSGSIAWRGMRPAQRKLTTTELLFGGRRGREWEIVRGDHPLLRGNVLVLASGKWPEACLDVLGSFDLARVQPYEESYLASWPAETYQLAVGDASLQARQRVVLEEQAVIRASSGAGVQDLTFNPAGVLVTTFRLLLLPVWLATMQVEGKKALAVINGQNGEVCGQAGG